MAPPCHRRRRWPAARAGRAAARGRLGHRTGRRARPAGHRRGRWGGARCVAPRPASRATVRGPGCRTSGRTGRRHERDPASGRRSPSDAGARAAVDLVTGDRRRRERVEDETSRRPTRPRTRRPTGSQSSPSRHSQWCWRHSHRPGATSRSIDPWVDHGARFLTNGRPVRAGGRGVEGYSMPVIGWRPDRIRTGDLQRDRLACLATTPRVLDRARRIAEARRPVTSRASDGDVPRYPSAPCQR